MTIKIKKLTKTEDKITVLIEGINNSIANTIRRSVLEIPVLAIDTVEFSKNDSALYDEMLAHRLGLVSLKTPKTFTEKVKCSCKGKGCLKCTASLKLKAKGPCNVYASELKAKGVEVAYPETLIVLLAKDQELEFSAEATLGIGKEHAKYTPGLLWFVLSPTVNEIKQPKAEQKESIIQASPEQFALLKEGKAKIVHDFINEIVESEGKFLKVEINDKNFIFNIESFGQLKPNEIFIEAIKVLDGNLSQLTKQIKKIK